MKYVAGLAVGMSVIAGTSPFSYAACTKRANQEVLNQLTETANNGCLAMGGEYRLEAGADGKINFVSTKVGSLDGKVTVDVAGQPNGNCSPRGRPRHSEIGSAREPLLRSSLAKVL